MTSADVPLNKVCPKCKQTDRTTFSTCRYCGARYENRMQQQAQGSTSGLPVLPIMLLALCALVGVGISAFLILGRVSHTVDVYSHPEKLVGKSFYSMSTHMIAAPTEPDLISFDDAFSEAKKNDPKLGGNGFQGIEAASQALSSLNSNKDNSFSTLFRYLSNGQIDVMSTTNGAQLKVMIIAGGHSPKYHIARVKVLNGPKLGSICWINVDELIIKTD